jgi:alpha-glucoside transport system substrate-binding protein
MPELRVLVEEIAERDDIDPWCFSIFSGTATGWPATDWVEDLVLRRAGPEIYDDWAAGRLSWQHPGIRTAFEEFQTLVLDDERSFGGIRSVLQTDVTRASEPLLSDPPGCVLYKQASFAEEWLPAEVAVGPGQDVDTFVLPGLQPDASPIVTSGDGAVQFEERPNVNRLMDFLASPAGGEAWADAGGFVSALSSVDITSYFGAVDAGFAEVLLDDGVSRFDASDVLPADVGSGLLWRRITSWIEGTITLDELLTSIDAALDIDPD